MREEQYSPKTALYFEGQEFFDNLTIQDEVKYHLENHHFSNIIFSNKNIVGNLKNCVFRNCTFENFDGKNISFENASFNNCQIINSNMKKCNFESVGMSNLQIINSDFTDANFAAAEIGNTRFDGNDLSGVKFHGATLDDVIITDATVNKPVEGLYIENISMDGSTFQELEKNRNRIFSELKLEPVAFAQELENTVRSLEPLTEHITETISKERMNELINNMVLLIKSTFESESIAILKDCGFKEEEIKASTIDYSSIDENRTAQLLKSTADKILNTSGDYEMGFNILTWEVKITEDELRSCGYGEVLDEIKEMRDLWVADDPIARAERISEEIENYEYEDLEPANETVTKNAEPITKQTVVVNCFAGPGAGKTTCAWEIASELKKRGIEAEYVGEYAKELVWDGNTELLDGSLKSQQHLYDVQNHRVQRLLGKVDVIVTDSPAIIGAMYLKEPNIEFEQKVIVDFNKQHNFNLFINRGDTFQQAGRVHNLEESKTIDNNIKSFLEKYNIYYGTYEHSTIDKVVKNIQTHLEKANQNYSFSNNHPVDELVNEKELKLQQYTIIDKFNPAPNTYQTWIRSVKDIKTFEDTLKDSDYAGWEQNGFDESYTYQTVQNALDSGKITVYSSHPIEQGVFVTPSLMEAQSYSGDGKIYSKEVDLKAVAWIDPTQGQYADVEKYAAQMVTEPVIVARFKEQDTINVIMQYPNGLYYNYYGYDAEKNISDSNAGRFKTLDEAKEIMLKHRNTSIEILENRIEPQTLTLEEFLAQQGLRSPVDDFMIDKTKLPHGQSKYDERKMHENARKSSQEYHSKRNAAIQEYQEKIAAGEIIEPTNVERYIKAAQEHPNNASTQAARRVLAKRGYTQNANGDWVLKESEINQLSKDVIQPKQTKSLSKEDFDKLTSEIKDIAKTYQSDPDLLTDYFAFKAQFYQYSPTNTMLIHLQNPHATFVGSYTFWKNKGYGIKKGQHHIKISRPIETSRFSKEINGKTVWTDIKYASSEEKAKIAEGKLEIKKTTKFIPHQVFDISQTTCPIEDYPKFYNMGHPDMEQQQLYECIKQYAKECGFTVTEEDLSSISLHGYYDRTDDSIHINSLLEDSERLRTMCHELAHGVLHKTSTQPVEIMEFEAECFSAMLKRKMGFPISEESKRYIKQYFTKSNVLNNGKFDMSKTLDRLSKTFNHISNGIDTTISNMGFCREKELSHNLAQANNKAVDVNKISENFMQALS